MAEPLSYLNPPEDRVRPVPVNGAGKKLEWMLVDYDAAKMPGSEVFLPGLWKRMHDDGTFNMFCHELPDMNFMQFVNVLTTKSYCRIQLVIGHDEEGTAKEHAGIVILDNILYNDHTKRAMGNFAFFKEYWHRNDSLQLGKAVMDHWFNNMKFDVISGLTPRNNRAAISFIKRLGFQILGDLPTFTTYEHKVSNSAISFMTAEMWMAKRETI